MHCPVIIHNYSELHTTLFRFLNGKKYCITGQITNVLLCSTWFQNIIRKTNLIVENLSSIRGVAYIKVKKSVIFLFFIYMYHERFLYFMKYLVRSFLNLISWTWFLKRNLQRDDNNSHLYVNFWKSTLIFTTYYHFFTVKIRNKNVYLYLSETHYIFDWVAIFLYNTNLFDVDVHSYNKVHILKLVLLKNWSVNLNSSLLPS